MTQLRPSTPHGGGRHRSPHGGPETGTLEVLSIALRHLEDLQDALVDGDYGERPHPRVCHAHRCPAEFDALVASYEELERRHIFLRHWWQRSNDIIDEHDENRLVMDSAINLAKQYLVAEEWKAASYDYLNVLKDEFEAHGAPARTWRPV